MCCSCVRLGLTCLAYLWRRNQEELLDEMIRCSIEAILIKVAALGLSPGRHLGKSLAELQPGLIDLVSHVVCGAVFFKEILSKH